MLQKKASDMVKHITMETIQEVYLSTTPEILTIADLGCSCGPNSLSMIRDLYHAVDDAYKKTLINSSKSPINNNNKLSSVSVYLNDLPTNDFNSIFRALPDFLKEVVSKEDDGIKSSCLTHQGYFRPSLFVAASPGSFYTSIFPTNFLHFVYSSYSLHWLSKVGISVWSFMHSFKILLLVKSLVLVKYTIFKVYMQYHRLIFYPTL